VGETRFRKDTEHPVQAAPWSQSTVGPVVAAKAFSSRASWVTPNASAAEEFLQYVKKSRRDIRTNQIPFLP
jgi:hypothetical protein